MRPEIRKAWEVVDVGGVEMQELRDAIASWLYNQYYEDVTEHYAWSEQSEGFKNRFRKDAEILLARPEMVKLKEERDSYRKQVIAGIYDSASVGITLIKTELLKELREKAMKYESYKDIIELYQDQTDRISGLEKELKREEIERLRGDVREWLCSKCHTVYPSPPTKGFDCVVCPKCGGDTAPRSSQAMVNILKDQLSTIRSNVAEITGEWWDKTDNELNDDGEILYKNFCNNFARAIREQVLKGVGE